MLQRSLIFMLFGAISWSTSPPAYSQELDVSQGPIELRDQHPLSLLHSTFRPQDASILPVGSYRVGMNFAWSNTLNYKRDHFQVDSETRVEDFFFRRGIAAGLELQFSQ